MGKSVKMNGATASNLEKVKLGYRVGEHPEQPDTVVISVSGTGIDVKNEKHIQFMRSVVNVVGSMMYAHANGMEIRNIVGKMEDATNGHAH